jgi:hypothetical protein
VQFRTEIFNPFNRVPFGHPNRQIGNPQFGVIRVSSTTARGAVRSPALILSLENSSPAAGPTGGRKGGN